jgi:phosphoribosylanthranilate isomerase
MKIKVCGVTQIELDELGIDYAGMIFYQQSARYMMDKLKSTEVSNLPLSLKKVGVFVNASVENIQTQVELYGLDLVQLHGDETPAFCKFISQFVSVIKAFRITKYNEENMLLLFI